MPRRGAVGRTLLQHALDAEGRYRNLCHRSLRDGVSFDDLEALVKRLAKTRRERWARSPSQARYFKALDRAEVWLALATGAAAERGRTSEWPDEASEALDDVANAIRRLLAVLGRHPSFGLDARALVTWCLDALRTEREERGSPLPDSLGTLDLLQPRDFTNAYERLRSRFRSARPGRTRAVWRSETITLLRQAGVSRRDAEELADTAGLTADAAPDERRGRDARQKQRARARRRRSQKLTSE